MISPVTSSDDSARQLSYADLEVVTAELAAHRSIIISSLQADDLETIRHNLGDASAEALLRELALFVRRNLRGADALCVQGDEVVILFDAIGEAAPTVADRLLAAVRGHVFYGGASDRALRLTISLGVAIAPDHGSTLATLLSVAREARAAVLSDGSSVAHEGPTHALDLHRFVGRDQELATFADYLDDMVRGVGRVVAVLGERGVGASTLVRGLEPEIRLRGGSLVIGSAYNHQLPAPYALWSAVLRAVRRLPVKSTRVWRELPALDRDLEVPRHGGSKMRLLEELSDFLRLAAQQRPLVILLEDMQWADAAAWDALENLLVQIESERILIVLTQQTSARDDPSLERWKALVGRPRHHEMQLSRLTRDEAKRWLEGAMRTGEAGRDLLAYLYRHTAGNPFHLIQLVRDLAEAGHIGQQEHSWHWSPIASLPLRTSIDDLVARRIERISPAARQVLDAASVLGRECDESLLVDMTGLPSEDVIAACHVLLASGFLASSYARERALYTIAHHEIARVVRERLRPAQRIAVHGRVAHALTSRRTDAAEVAAHFERAGEQALAHRYALIAADEALAVHETVAVAELLAAAERTAPSHADLAAVRVRMVTAAEAGGRYEEAEALCNLALAWYSSQRDRLNEVRIRRTRSLVRTKRGQTARETLEELLALEKEASEIGADAERGAILLIISQMHWRLGDMKAGREVAEQAVEMAERGTDQVLLADAYNRLATGLQLEDPPRSRLLYAKALKIATELGDTFRRVRQHNNMGVLETLSNNWDEARRMLRLAADSARTSGLLDHWGRAELNLGVLAARIGDYAGAAQALSEALRLTAIVQSSDDQLYATYNIAHLERETERYRQAIGTYVLVTELAERIGQVEVQAGAIAGEGLCHIMLGDSAGARRAWEAARPLMDRLTIWFQGRELVESLILHLSLLDESANEAAALFIRALELAGGTDDFGAAWLTAEFGGTLRSQIPEVVDRAVAQYANTPEVLGSPYLLERFAVLKTDSHVTIDRIGPNTHINSTEEP